MFLMNQLQLTGATFAAVFKDRWWIGLSFKALNPSPRLKKFAGTGANAVAIQTWTAPIAMLRVKYLLLRSTYEWSLSHLVALFWQLLSVCRDLMTWLNESQALPGGPDTSPQMALQLE